MEQILFDMEEIFSIFFIQKLLKQGSDRFPSMTMNEESGYRSCHASCSFNQPESEYSKTKIIYAEWWTKIVVGPIALVNHATDNERQPKN